MAGKLSKIGLALIVTATILSAGKARCQGPTTVRVATFNVSLYGKKPGEIRSRLSDQDDAQAKKIASIVQSVQPDVLLVNELDYESDAAPAQHLNDHYFSVAQENAGGGDPLKPIDYAYIYAAPSNTGIDSKQDLNHDGKLGTGNDAWGYGVYPGQYSFAIFSRFPIDEAKIRTFQKMLWKDLPGALRPIDPRTNTSYYSDDTWSRLRLSSKNHVDVPVRIGNEVLHVLASHPTPPVFDGPEDRNGCRNHDEIEFWNHYLNDAPSSSAWLIDDAGVAGGLNVAERFVIMGDLNADPIDGSGRHESILRLIGHPRVQDVKPSCGKQSAAERASRFGGKGELLYKTADFGRNGMMRVDFVLPSRSIASPHGEVVWPPKSDPRAAWISGSDHRMVWADLRWADADQDEKR